MNWEVRTMPSKTSFCNGTEFRKCLSRWWPLWVIYGVILFIMLPGVLLNARSTIPYVSTGQISYLSNVILSETQMLLPLTAFCAGLLAAAAMFGYLYTPRGAGLAASLPIRRGCMFRTHLLAGLVMLLSAEAVIFGLAVLIEATRFELVIEPLLIWLGILALETVVFYGIAVLCAMFTGHVVMLPCLYLLVNFIAVGFQLLVEAVLYTFVYGMSGMADLPVDWLSPLVLFMRRTSVGHADLVRPISGTEAEVAIANFSGWIYPLVWAAFALLLLVCAGQLYRRRRMESAGDTVAIPVLKPVLKYIVALFAGLAMPVGVYGTMGRAWLTDSGTRQSTAYAVTIGYQLSQYDPATGETTYADVNYTPLTDSTRTLAWLRAHGIEPLLEGDSIKYGGDADTQPAINTYETTDSSFGR